MLTSYSKIELMINKNNEEFNLKEYDENLYYFIFNTLIEIDKMFYLDSFEISTLPFYSSQVSAKVSIREYRFCFDIFTIEYGMNYGGLTMNDLINDIKIEIEREHMRKIRKDM